MSSPGKINHKIRADEDFVFKLRKVIPERVQNFPEDNPRDLTDRELTRMMTNAPSFDNVLKELKKLPRRTR